MSWMVDWLGAGFVYALGWTLLHSLWQGALVAVVLALVLAATPRWSANARYLCAVLALGVVIVLSVLTYSRYYLMVEAAFAEAAGSTPEPVLMDSGSGFSLEALAYWLNRHISAIVLFWMLGFALFLARYCGGLFYCHRLKTRLSRAPEPGWQARVEVLAQSIGVGRAVALKLSHQVAGPCVVGHLKPVILLPVALLIQLSRDELEAILLHELAHIRRNDYLVGLIQSLIKTLYFFNWPVLWMSAQVDRERENACDDIAADGCKSRTFYAETLARFSALVSGRSASNDGGLTMAVNGKQNHLMARIRRLFESDYVANRPFEGVLSSVLLLVLGLFLSVHSQAEDLYPDIQTLDDTSVQSLIDTYREQLHESEEENHFVTTLVPTGDYQALSAAEQKAFTRYFQESLWQDHYRDKERPEFYEHLDDAEWLEARRLFLQQDYGHFLRALSGELSATEQFETVVPDQTQPIRFAQFEGGRMEAEVPLDALRALLETPDQRVEAGPFVLRMLDDGSLLLVLQLTDNVNQVVLNRRAVREDFAGDGVLAGEMQYLSYNDDTERGQRWSFVALDDSYQIWLGPDTVDQLLIGKNAEGLSQLSGYRVNLDRVLEVAFDPKPRETITSRIMTFMNNDKVPHAAEVSQELEALLAKLPSELHEYLYQEQHFERQFLAWSLRTGVELSERQRPYFRDLFQKNRAEFLLEASLDPEREALEFAHRSISMWVDDAHWVNLYPVNKESPNQLFDLIIEEASFSDATNQIAEKCESIEPPEGYKDIAKEVSLYGFEVHCTQLQGVLDRYVEKHSNVASR